MFFISTFTSLTFPFFSCNVNLYILLHISLAFGTLVLISVLSVAIVANDTVSARKINDATNAQLTQFAHSTLHFHYRLTVTALFRNTKNFWWSSFNPIDISNIF